MARILLTLKIHRKLSINPKTIIFEQEQEQKDI